MFPKSYPAISHDHFSIQIESRYISHRSLFDQKEGHAVLYDHFSDQKEGHIILHNLKLILEIDLFVRQGRGVLHMPHMYLDF